VTHSADPPVRLRDRVLTAVAVTSVVAALAVVLAAVLRRGDLTPPGESSAELDAPSTRAPRESIASRAAPTSQPADPVDDLGANRVSAWVPAPLPEEDTSGGATATGATALKKCCDALRAAPKRALGQAADTCDRVFTTLSSRSGPLSDALASAALDAVREALARQAKGSSVPAACR
jgi:hypothetical protein